jgi:hypothetical protein
MRRLMKFVEGDGEADAVPTRVKRLLTEKGAWHDILLDDDTLRVGSETGLRDMADCGGGVPWRACDCLTDVSSSLM